MNILKRNPVFIEELTIKELERVLNHEHDNIEIITELHSSGIILSNKKVIKCVKNYYEGFNKNDRCYDISPGKITICSECHKHYLRKLKENKISLIKR